MLTDQQIRLVDKLHDGIEAHIKLLRENLDFLERELEDARGSFMEGEVRGINDGGLRQNTEDLNAAVAQLSGASALLGAK